MTRAKDVPCDERLERGARRIDEVDEVDEAELVIFRGARGHLPRMGSRSPHALVLTSGLLLLGGCGVRTELLDPGAGAASPSDDAGPDTVVPVEVHPDTGAAGDEVDVVELPQLGTCAFGDQSIVCVPGDVCHANFVVGPSPFICGPSADPSTPCGLIACGAGCACADATSSTCRCE